MIQRASSAIKELLENSLDAGATKIVITIKEGIVPVSLEGVSTKRSSKSSIKSIIVQDNGCGIDKEDYPLLCCRYATSKIKESSDLSSLDTFGFRGEALASMSHVSRVSVVSQTKNSNIGWKANFIDGNLVDKPTPLASNPGTTIIIDDLFYNNPVRSLYCRVGEEISKIADILQKYSIAFSFKASISSYKISLQNSSSCMLSTPLPTPSTSSPEEMMKRAISISFSPKLIENIILIPPNSILTSPLISSFTAWTGNSYFNQKKFNLSIPSFSCFINGRLVEFPRLKRTLTTEVWDPLLQKGGVPFVFLALTVPSCSLDHNIHPSKEEVLLSEEEGIISLIVKAIKDAVFDSATVTKPPTIYSPQSLLNSSVTTLPSSQRSISQSVTQHLQPQQSSQSQSKRAPYQQRHTDHTLRTLDRFLVTKSASPGVNVGMILNKMIVPENPFVDAFDDAEGPLGIVQPTAEEQQCEANSPSLQESMAKIHKTESNRWDKMRLSSEFKTNLSLTDGVAKHTFVGFHPTVSDSNALKTCFLQLEMSLYLGNCTKILSNWYYQYLIWNCGSNYDGGIGNNNVNNNIYNNNNNVNNIKNISNNKIKRITKSYEFQDCLREFIDKCSDKSIRAIINDPSIETLSLMKDIQSHSLFTKDAEGVLDVLGFSYENLLITFTFPFEDSEASLKSCIGEIIFRLAMEFDDGKQVEYGQQQEEEIILMWSSVLANSHIKSLYGDDREVMVLDFIRKTPSPSKGYPNSLAEDGSLKELATTQALYRIFERC